MMEDRAPIAQTRHRCALPVRYAPLMTDPHYLRFVRTLALVSSIGGVGCGMSTTDTDAAVATADANAPDAFFDCASCDCGFSTTDAGLPACGAEHVGCCAAVGPLAPPDLAA